MSWRKAIFKAVLKSGKKMEEILSQISDSREDIAFFNLSLYI